MEMNRIKSNEVKPSVTVCASIPDYRLPTECLTTAQKHTSIYNNIDAPWPNV